MMTMTNTERPYLPAAGRDIFLPLYDPLTSLLGMNAARQTLLDNAALGPNQRVLDVGCGTGTLAVMIRRLHPTIEVIGVDPDPKALRRAERKARQAGVAVRFDRGYADALGYADGTFDRLFSSMMFHHLDDGVKVRALGEFRRVLRPGGRLELLDFSGDPHAHGFVSRVMHAHHRLQNSTDERLLTRLASAGFTDVAMRGAKQMLFGRVSYFEATAA